MDSHAAAEKAEMAFGKYAHLLSQTFGKKWLCYDC